MNKSADLKKLFDYQRFEQEEDLQMIINHVESKYGLNACEMEEASPEEVEICFEAAGSKITDIRTKKGSGRSENRHIPFVKWTRIEP